jgi:3D (Asp-Asp-Asp) domain-containing protein
MTFEATAYTLEDGNGDGLTATITVPVKDRTIAADWRILPPGTELTINGVPGYIVEDTGGAIKGNRLDIYMGSGQAAYERAIEFGRRQVEVVIE